MWGVSCDLLVYQGLFCLHCVSMDYLTDTGGEVQEERKHWHGNSHQDRQLHGYFKGLKIWRGGESWKV